MASQGSSSRTTRRSRAQLALKPTSCWGVSTKCLSGWNMVKIYMIQEIIGHLRMLADVLKRLARLLDAEVADLEQQLVEDQDLEDKDLDNEATDGEDDMYGQIEEIVID